MGGNDKSPLYIYNCQRTNENGSRGIAWQWKALAALAEEDLGAVPSTHMAANCCN